MCHKKRITDNRKFSTTLEKYVARLVQKFRVENHIFYKTEPEKY